MSGDLSVNLVPLPERTDISFGKARVSSRHKDAVRFVDVRDMGYRRNGHISNVNNEILCNISILLCENMK